MPPQSEDSSLFATQAFCRILEGAALIPAGIVKGALPRELAYLNFLQGGISSGNEHDPPGDAPGVRAARARNQ
jgi:hypothetical protein